ncbi:hypothetical protein ACWD4Z_38600, partial [Streptomyces antibioticus]
PVIPGAPHVLKGDSRSGRTSRVQGMYGGVIAYGKQGNAARFSEGRGRDLYSTTCPADLAHRDVFQASEQQHGVKAGARAEPPHAWTGSSTTSVTTASMNFLPSA